MSFLNPVTEPVLRFKSTDAGAPQINYNARVAGDVKAVLKACLVTGYGAKASAGWSIVNEVNHVCEFVSPSVAMSDYRLGIDDTSASSTTWYYQYQGNRINPGYNLPSKNTIYIDSGTTKNGWEMLITDRGLFFIDLFYHTTAAEYVARITWWGQVKSALTDTAGANISFFCGGYESQTGDAYRVFVDGASSGRHYKLATYTQTNFAAANLPTFLASQKTYGLSSLDIIADIYLIANNTIIGQQVGMSLRDVNSSDDALGVKPIEINERQALSIALSSRVPTKSALLEYAKVVIIYTDYWEY